VCEIQIQWRHEFATEPPTKLTVSRIRGRFEASGTEHNVRKQRSGWSCTATSSASAATLLEQCTRSSQKSAKQFAPETGITRSSAQLILKRAKWKVYIPTLLRAMNEEDSYVRVQFCEWFQHKVHEDEEFMSKIVWSDEATFKLVVQRIAINYVYCVARTTTVPPPFCLAIPPFDESGIHVINTIFWEHITVHILHYISVQLGQYP
jgi:hypothetical protein